jgi:acetyl esterase
VYFHGGGFVTGDLDTHDDACRTLCHDAGVSVLAVDYRLAPEHPFPAAVDDAFSAFRWAAAHAAELGADPARIGVAGDSAGGNLSAVVAQLAARDGGATPFLQVLIYPTTDMRRGQRSRSLFARGFLLESDDMDWYDENYLGGAHEKRLDPRASPVLGADLRRVCPAIVVTAGFDPLRDEGNEYASALEGAGVPTRLVSFDGLIHGFVNMGAVSPAARNALGSIGEAVRAVSATRQA